MSIRRKPIKQPIRRSKSPISLTPTEYEKAVLERFRILFPSPDYVVRHNVRLPGRKSRKSRQTDIAIFEIRNPKPFLIVDAKRLSRAVDVGKAGITIALVQDIGSVPAVMVATSGFSGAAKNHLSAEGIETLVITLMEAKALRWIPALEREFSVDAEFKEISGRLVEALRKGDMQLFLESDTPYEEWLAIFAVGQLEFPKSTSRVLKAIARHHSDDGVRFNAILLLNNAGPLNRKYLEGLLSDENDPEKAELLSSLLSETS